MYVLPVDSARKNPHAVALAKLGAAKGGHASAAALTPEERSVRARKAVQARWAARDAAQGANAPPGPNGNGSKEENAPAHDSAAALLDVETQDERLARWRRLAQQGRAGTEQELSRSVRARLATQAPWKLPETASDAEPTDQ